MKNLSILTVLFAILLAGCAVKEEPPLTGKELPGVTVAGWSNIDTCAVAAAALGVFQDAGCFPAPPSKATILIRQQSFRRGNYWDVILTITRKDGTMIDSRRLPPTVDKLEAAQDMAREVVNRLAKLRKLNPQYFK